MIQVERHISKLLLELLDLKYSYLISQSIQMHVHDRKICSDLTSLAKAVVRIYKIFFFNLPYAELIPLL